MKKLPKSETRSSLYLPSMAPVGSASMEPKSVSELSLPELWELVSGLSLILGRKGTGKTYFMAAVASIATTERLRGLGLKQLVIYDPTGSLTVEYAGEQELFIAETSDEIHSAFVGNKFPLAVTCSPFDEETFGYLCEVVWQKGNTLFIVDEGDTALLQSNVRHLTPAMQNIISRSRHRNIALMVSVRRPQEIPTGVRSFVERLIVFQTRMERDIQAIREIDGEDIDETVLRSLGRGQFLIIT